MRRKGASLLDALDQVGPVEAMRRQPGLGVACVEIKYFGRPIRQPSTR